MVQLFQQFGAKTGRSVETGKSMYGEDAMMDIWDTPHDPDFERQMKVAQEVMKRHRDLLRELAKK
jgi:hypothetical protein